MDGSWSARELVGVGSRKTRRRRADRCEATAEIRSGIQSSHVREFVNAKRVGGPDRCRGQTGDGCRAYRVVDVTLETVAGR